MSEEQVGDVIATLEECKIDKEKSWSAEVSEGEGEVDDNANVVTKGSEEKPVMAPQNESVPDGACGGSTVATSGDVKNGEATPEFSSDGENAGMVPVPSFSSFAAGGRGRGRSYYNNYNYSRRFRGRGGSYFNYDRGSTYNYPPQPHPKRTFVGQGAGSTTGSLPPPYKNYPYNHYQPQNEEPPFQGQKRFEDFNREKDVYKIFVGGVQEDMTEEDLIKCFSVHGVVEGANIKRDEDRVPKRIYGFVTFAREESVNAAIQTRMHLISGHTVEAKSAFIQKPRFFVRPSNAPPPPPPRQHYHHVSAPTVEHQYQPQQQQSTLTGNEGAKTVLFKAGNYLAGYNNGEVEFQDGQEHQQVFGMQTQFQDHHVFTSYEDTNSGSAPVYTTPMYFQTASNVQFVDPNQQQQQQAWAPEGYKSLFLVYGNNFYPMTPSTELGGQAQGGFGQGQPTFVYQIPQGGGGQQIQYQFQPAQTTTTFAQDVDNGQTSSF